MARKQLIRCPVCEKDIASHKEELIETLGLDKNQEITEEEVKKAYKTLAKELHPDKGGSVEDFQEVKDAKEELIDMLNNSAQEPSEEVVQQVPTFEQRQNFKHALRNLRTQLKPKKPCPYCKRKY